MALYWQLPVGRHVFYREAQSITRELNKKKEKKKILQRYPKHEPIKIRKQKIHQKYKSSSAKDLRYSNQKRLRRMYRNG